jgi:hypothetical protein
MLLTAHADSGVIRSDELLIYSLDAPLCRPTPVIGRGSPRPRHIQMLPIGPCEVRVALTLRDLLKILFGITRTNDEFNG